MPRTPLWCLMLWRLLSGARSAGVERERLALLLQTAPVAIVVTDSAHRIVEFNAAAVELFGASRAGMRGVPLHAFLVPGTYARYLRLCAGMQGVGVDMARGEARRTDGERCIFEFSLTTFADRAGHRFHTLAARPARALRHRRRDDAADALFRESEMRQAGIARELHDAVGSSLAGVSLLLAAASSFTREPEAAALIGRSQKQVTIITQQVRQISRGMLPAGQDRGALLAALYHFTAEMNAIPGVHCRLQSRGNFEQVPPDVGNHLYRIVQEATTNALRHGEAGRVRITLARGAARCRLTVRDDGRGCDLAARAGAEQGIGIRSMRARAEAIGGSFGMVSTAGAGTRVLVTWEIAHESVESTFPRRPGSLRLDVIL